MIHEVTGDILLSGAQAVAHGVAPNDHFDKGLALALREKWPVMHKDFRHYANQSHPKPGEIWAWGGFGTRIYNLLTQEGSFEHGVKPGRATLAHVNHCLRRLRHALEKDQITSLAVSKLATGVGGLSWDDVKPLIKTHLEDLPINIYVYSHYQPNVKAHEPAA